MKPEPLREAMESVLGAVERAKRQPPLSCGAPGAAEYRWEAGAPWEDWNHGDVWLGDWGKHAWEGDWAKAHSFDDRS